MPELPRNGSARAHEMLDCWRAYSRSDPAEYDELVTEICALKMSADVAEFDSLRYALTREICTFLKEVGDYLHAKDSPQDQNQGVLNRIESGVEILVGKKSVCDAQLVAFGRKGAKVLRSMHAKNKDAGRESILKEVMAKLAEWDRIYPNRQSERDAQYSDAAAYRLIAERHSRKNALPQLWLMFHATRVNIGSNRSFKK